MLKYIYIVLFLLVGVVAQGQIPGYQGKKLFIEGAISLIPLSKEYQNKNLSIDALSSSNFIQKHKKQVLHLKYQLGINYIVGRKVALYTNLHLFSFQNRYKFEVYSPWSSVSHLKLHKANIIGTSLGGLFYVRGRANLAPLGWHIKMGVRVSTGKMQELTHDVGNYSGIMRYLPIEELPSYAQNDEFVLEGVNYNPANRFMIIQPEIGIGYRYVFVDKITLRLAADFLFWGITHYDKRWDTIHENFGNGGLGNSTIENMVRRQAVNITIGVGMLIK